MTPLAQFTVITAGCVTLMLAAIQGQVALPPGQQAVPSDLEIQQAVTAIEQADSYADVLATTEKYAAIISSPRVVELVDAALQNAALNDAQRRVLLLERQLSIDCRVLGAAAAIRLLAVRAIAGFAIQADTPQQFATVLEKFSPLASVITVDLVGQALNTPGNTWPKPLLPLMEQLARDWPTLGALEAATKMAAAANEIPNPNTDPGPKPPPGGTPTLVGHWRSTTISLGSPRDEHFVVRGDGTAETWIVTASGRTPVTPGRWSTKGTSLSVEWEDGRQWGQPFTFHEGQLVFPNVPNQRQFWEAIR